jgi:hypothetical protein
MWNRGSSKLADHGTTTVREGALGFPPHAFLAWTLKVTPRRQSYDDITAAAAGADVLVGHPVVFAAPPVTGRLYCCAQ